MVQIINGRQHRFTRIEDGRCEIEVEGVADTFVAIDLATAVLIARNYDLAY